MDFSLVERRSEYAKASTNFFTEPASSCCSQGRSVAMSETFGHRLKQFALAVDIVDEDIFKQVWELVRRYVSRDLELAYWALLVEGTVDKNPGLQARECSN